MANQEPSYVSNAIDLVINKMCFSISMENGYVFYIGKQ